MLSHVINRIKSNHQISIYHLLYLFVTILVVFLLLGFRDAAVNKMELKVTFYEKAVMFGYGSVDQYFPEGFYPAEKQIEKIKESFQYVTTYKNVSMDTSIQQHVAFAAVSDCFIHTGVKCFDYFIRKGMVEKVDLITGEVWEKDSKEPVVVIDENTANLIFGYTNVVGQTLPTMYGELKILGIVTNTTERSQMIARDIEAGQAIDNSMYPSNAYISQGYLSTLSGVDTYNDRIIIKDDSMKMDELKTNLKKILGVPEADNWIIQGRQEILDSEMMSQRVFFQIIVSLTSVFAFLGLINLINVSAFSYKINKKNVGIYKALGCSNRQFWEMSLLEGIVLGLFCSIVSIIVGFVILMIGTLVAATFVYIDFFHMIIISSLIVLTSTVIVAVINMIITMLSINRSILFYLKGE